MGVKSERRAEPRLRFRLPTYADYPNRCSRVRDISLAGAFIEDSRPLPPGRLLTPELWLNEYEPLEIKAVIRRVEPQSGMGVAFLSMGEANYDRLQRMMAPVASLS